MAIQLHKKALEFLLELKEETKRFSKRIFYYCILTVYTYVFREWDSQAVFQAEIYAIELPP